jgi:hypothetical protein
MRADPIRPFSSDTSRQHQIENDNVVVKGFNKPEAFIAIAGRVNLKALFSQPRSDESLQPF